MTNKTLQEITTMFDINTIAASFNAQYIQNMNHIFTGTLTLLMFKRSETDHVLEHLNGLEKYCLHGWMPGHLGDKTEYDFLLTPLIYRETFYNLLVNIVSEVILLELILKQIEGGLIQIEGRL
jgi:hypothetical protein